MMMVTMILSLLTTTVSSIAELIYVNVSKINAVFKLIDLF